MPDKLINWYRAQLDMGALRPDSAQAMIVEAFQNAIIRAEQAESQSQNEEQGFFGKLLGGRKSAPATANGLYVYGGVGRGKTMIMDEAFALSELMRKKRSHFNDFMLDVHRRLKGLRERAKSENEDIQYLDEVASQIAAEVRLLAFDEFQVRDIADAMIMAGLFSALFAKGVVVLATSNVAPDDLYEGGLQRIRFLPFIEILKRHVDVVFMDSPTDYRLAVGGEAILNDLYLTPMGSASLQRLKAGFAHIVDNNTPETVALSLSGREWILKHAVRGKACLISFAESCEQPRAAEDYIALAEAFPIVFLHDVPKMGYDRRNEAKRFILLIDTLYDKNCRLVISAESEPDMLYFGKDHDFEFERTISRLQEMRRFSLEVK